MYRRTLIVFVVLVNFCAVKPIWAANIQDAVVKVFVAANRPDYYRPWQSQGVSASTGSGVIIEGKRILTNAHVVADHTFVQVQKNADPNKYTAQVVALGSDCDLAVLIVSDPDFFKGINPVPFGELPRQQDDVTVIGYPRGGDKLSITKGVVSRVEVTSYSQSGRQLLTIQIDAAINPGNSGGPVLQGEKLVGVAMQVLQSSQNIGYIIPMPVIRHFLSDLDDGHYDGFPVLGIEFDNTENPSLRKYFKIQDKQGGVVITRILPYSPVENLLKSGDVILRVDGVPIAQDATFQFREDERLLFSHLITQKQVNDKLPVQISRNGKVQTVTVGLHAYTPLVAYPGETPKPPYYIYGGFVFTVLSTDLLISWGNRWWEQSPIEFKYYLLGPGRLNLERRKDIVVLLGVLPDEINKGFHDDSNEVIKTVNGKKFRSFKEFVKFVHDGKNNSEFTEFTTENDLRVIISNNNIDEHNLEILRRNNINKPYSDDIAQWIDSGFQEK